MKKLGSLLAKPAALAASIALLAAFLAFAYPEMGARFGELTPAGAAFDLEFFYTPAEAAGKARLYDAMTAKDFAILHWTYDLAFPLCYGLFLASATAFCLRSLRGSETRYAFLLVPLASVAFDLLENAASSALVAAASASGGEKIFWMAALAPIASASTPLKWIFVAAAGAGAAGLAAFAAAQAVAKAAARKRAAR